MKKYLPIVNLVLLIILFCFGFYIWHRFNITLLEIRSINNGQIISNQVGIDWIIGLIDSNFSTVIIFVTVTFSLFGVATFISVKERLEVSQSSIKNDLAEQVKEWDNYKNHIKSIEGDLSFEVASRDHERLEILFNKTNNSYDGYVRTVELSLITCEYYSKSLLLKSDIRPKFEKYNLKSVSVNEITEGFLVVLLLELS